MSKLGILIKIAKKKYLTDKDLEQSSKPDFILRNALISRINHKPKKLTTKEKELASKLKLTDTQFDDLLSRITTSRALSETTGMLIGGEVGSMAGAAIGSSLGSITVGPIGFPIGATIGSGVGGLLGGSGGSNAIKEVRNIYAQKHLDLLNPPSGFQDKKLRGIKNNK